MVLQKVVQRAVVTVVAPRAPVKASDLGYRIQMA
jgi:hypothetical protein